MANFRNILLILVAIIVMPIYSQSMVPVTINEVFWTRVVLDENGDTIYKEVEVVVPVKKCTVPPIPKWDREEYKYINEYLSSDAVTAWPKNFTNYLKCRKEIRDSLRALDTLGLRTELKLPSLKDFNEEVGFSKIRLALDSISQKDIIEWGKKNLFTGVEIGFSGFVARPNEFANLEIPDDYLFGFEIRKKASESCLTCPENLFGRKDEELKKDEDKESYAFNKQGMQYRLQWDFLRRDADVYTQQRQYARYTKIYKRYGFWIEVDHKKRQYESINLYGSNQEYLQTGVRILYRVNKKINLTFGYNMRATPWASYTDEFLNWYERATWDTDTEAQNVFYDFNNNGEWENEELVGTYTEVLEPVLNEPYVTNIYNAKKRIWAYQGSPVIGLDLFSESKWYFFNIFANFYPYPQDLRVPARQYVYSGNGVELKSFGMEADWAPSENVFEYDGGIEAGLKIGRKFDLVLSGEISNYYGVRNYRTTFGVKYKL